MELAEHIFLNRVVTAQPEWIADVLGRLVWLTSDNGEEICNTLRRWVEFGDEDRTRIALLFNEVFLWKDTAEMNEVLSSIASRLPQLALECTAQRAAWAAQHSGG